jgi:hypothetical protein
MRTSPSSISGKLVAFGTWRFSEQEDKGQSLEDRGWRTEVGGQRLEDRGWRTDVGGQRLEDRGWRTEVGGQRLEDRGWRTEVGGQRLEDGGQCISKVLVNFNAHTVRYTWPAKHSP